MGDRRHDLSAADLAYLERLKGGKQRTYSNKVQVGGLSWDKGHGYTVSVSGEKYEALAKQGSRFETALTAAIRHISSKLDREKWNLASFSEERPPLPARTHSFDTHAAVPEKEERPFAYVAEFYLKKSAESESRRIWPLLTTPKSWPGAPMLRIHVMADGSILDAELAE